MGVDAVSAASLPRVAARRRPVVTVTQGGTLSGEHRRRHTDAALDAARIVDVLGIRAPVPPPAVDRDGLRMDVVVLGVSGPAFAYPLIRRAQPGEAHGYFMRPYQGTELIWLYLDVPS